MAKKMAKKIIILGVTGSIGTSAVDVVRTHPDDFRIVAVSAFRSKEKYAAYAKRFAKLGIVKEGQAR